MSNMRRGLAILSVCLLLVTGCGSSFRNYFLGEPDVTVNDSANGGHIELKKGQVLDIVLADDYETSKCQWRDEEKYDNAILKNLGSKYEPGPTSGNNVGHGTGTTRYRAANSGTVHVTLVQESNANDVCRRFALDVTVR